MFGSGKKNANRVQAAAKKLNEGGNPVDKLPSWGPSGSGGGGKLPKINEVVSKPGGELKQVSHSHRTCAAVVVDNIFCKEPGDVVLLVSQGVYGRTTMNFLIEQIKRHPKFTLKRSFKTNSSVISSLYESYGDYGDGTSDDIYDAEDKWVDEAIKKILIDAINLNASDIHLTLRSQLKIQCRTYGMLQQVGESIVHSKGEKIIRAFFGTHVGKNIGREFDEKARFGANVSTVIEINKQPTIVKLRYQQAPGASLGDSKISMDIVMRITSVGDSIYVGSLADCGFDTDAINVLNRISNKDRGVQLVVGATNSGKSTTLQSFYQLAADNSGHSKKILLIEDPPEGHITGTNKQPLIASGDSDDPKDTAIQAQNALSAALRQDPDIVGIGEVRDPELTKMALEAALTGHLVGTTMHVSRWHEAYSRTIEFLRIPASVFCSAGMIQSIVAQTLVQKICPECSLNYEKVKAHSMYSDIHDVEAFILDTCVKLPESQTIDEEYLQRIGVPRKLWRVDYSKLRFLNNLPENKCKRCSSSPGVVGRVLVYEIFVPSRHPEVVRLLENHKFDAAYRMWINTYKEGESGVDGLSIERGAMDKANKGLICARNLLSILGDV